ncbi:MAG: hypothetical protein WCP69_05670 [Bacteroidota bacterium]
MEAETLKTNSPLRNKNRSLNNSLIIFDLPHLIDKMKDESTWVEGKLNAMILMNSPEKQIVLAALHEGTEIKSFQSNDSVSFHIIEGKLKFHTRKESVTLDKGQLLTLQKNIKYRMSTKEETVILLTFANGTMCQL